MDRPLVMELASAALLSIGTIFMLLGAVGVVRMPDLFTRSQTSAKTSSLGIACVFLAVAFYFDDLGVTARAVATIAFAFLTVPVAAHTITRAAHKAGVPLWAGTVFDQLRQAEMKEKGEQPGEAAGLPEKQPPRPPPGTGEDLGEIGEAEEKQDGGG